ncbi:MAG: hypothetical protein AAFW75_24620 [Cyanobacteria bacterium J06636_16]
MQKRLTSLLLLALLGGCPQPRSDATNYYHCDLTASAPFVTLVIKGDIESIMALADGTYIDIANNVLELSHKLSVPTQTLQPQLQQLKQIHPDFKWSPTE